MIGAAEHFGHRTPCGAHEPDGPDPLRLCPRDEMIGCGEHDERIVGRCIVDPPLDGVGYVRATNDRLHSTPPFGLPATLERRHET